MSTRPFAVGGRLAVPSAYIAAEPGRVGQALPLPGDRVAQGGKLQAGVAPTFRSAPERRVRSCDTEVATANSSWELTVGSSSKEKPTVTGGRRGDTAATRCQARHARKDVAQGSLSSLAALPARRGLGGAAPKNSDYLVCGAARTRTARRAAGPNRGPCATTPDPDVRKAFRSRGTACRPLRVRCRRTRKGRASPTPPW